jgi:hypothetical protein
MSTTVWAVYHEYEEESEEYSQHHEVLEALFATEEEAKKFHAAMPEYRDNSYYTIGPREVWDTAEERLNQ